MLPGKRNAPPVTVRRIHAGVVPLKMILWSAYCAIVIACQFRLINIVVVLGLVFELDSKLDSLFVTIALSNHGTVSWSRTWPNLNFGNRHFSAVDIINAVFNHCDEVRYCWAGIAYRPSAIFASFVLVLDLVGAGRACAARPAAINLSFALVLDLVGAGRGRGWGGRG